MNDLTELMLFTSGKSLINHPSLIGRDDFISIKARERLKQELLCLTERIPWRRKKESNKIDKPKLAIIADTYYEEEKEKEKFYMMNKWTSSSDIMCNYYIDAYNSTDHMYSSSLRISSTIGSDNGSIDISSYIISFYPVNSDEELMSYYTYNNVRNSYFRIDGVPPKKKNPYSDRPLLPLGYCEDIRKLQFETEILDKKRCAKCGKKITVYPKRFSKNIGYCSNCIKMIEKEIRSDKDNNDIYEISRYPKGWFAEDREYKEPWWLHL